MFLPITPQNVNAVAGAATLNGDGTVTSEALVTAALGTYTLTLGNNQVTPNSVVLASAYNGTNSAGDPTVTRVTPGTNAGSVTIVVTNRHATVALNGTIKIALVVFN